MVDISLDCDKDTLLMKCTEGPVCHEGSDTCWSGIINHHTGFINLENIIDERKLSKSNKSYVSKLFIEAKRDYSRLKEAVELIIESKDNNKKKFIEESADLLFHFLILP